MISFINLFIIYAQIWYKDKNIRSNLLKLVLYIIFGIILNLSLPFILKSYISYAAGNEFFIYPPSIILFYCLLFLLNKIIYSINGHSINNLITSISYLINSNFIEKILELDRSKYNINDIGGITNTLSKAQTALPSILSSLTIVVIPLIIEFATFIVIVFHLYGVNFCIYFILMGFLFFFISIQFSKYLNKNLIYSNQLQSKSMSYLVNILYNYETISYFGTKTKEISKYLKYQNYRAKNDFKYNYWMFINQIIKQLLFCSIFTFILYFIAKNIVSNKYEIADLVFVNSFLLQLFYPLFNLDSIFRNLNRGLIDFRELLNILVTPSKRVNINYTNSINKDDLKIKLLSFKNVHFAFNKKEKVFENLSFDIEKGDRILLMAPSGSGKSTLIKLIYKLFTINSGHIRINCRNINLLQQSEIVSVIGVVPQDIRFFDFSILENITYGAKKIDYLKLEKCLTLASCQNFIKKLPNGYNTIIGPNGILLSGGQKQRLAIARVFYHNPNLYIFDEALSALDDICKNAIINAINNINKEKAILFITHTKPKNMIFNKILTINNKKAIIKKLT